MSWAEEATAAQLEPGAEVAARPKERPDDDAGAAAVDVAAGARAGALVPAELVTAVAMLGKEKPLNPAPSSSPN